MQRRLSRTFWLLWSGTTVSSLGDGFLVVGFPLLAASITKNPALIAGLLVAERLPALLLSLPAGAIADRADQRRLAVGIELARMALLGVLGLAVATHHVTLPLLYGLAFSLGALETTFFATVQANVPRLVDRERLMLANGYLSSASAAGETMLGPAIGGLLFAVHPALPFVADGISFAVSGALVFRVLPGRARAEQRMGVSTLFADMVDGLRCFLGDGMLRALAALIACLAFCQAMVNGVLIVYALHTLHTGRSGYGVFLAIGATGAIVGGALVHRLDRRIGTGRLIASVALLTSLTYPALAATTSAGVAAVIVFAATAMVSIGNVTTLSVRQSAVPHEVLGRVSSAFRTCIFGAVPVGAFVGGLLAEAIGVRPMFVVAGTLQLVVAVPLARRVMTSLRSPASVIDLTAAPVEAALVPAT